MLSREPLDPPVEIAVGDLDDAMTAVADQVVVVRIAAPAVAELARVVRELVDGSGLRKESERAIHGREPEVLAAVSQPGVEFLRRDVVAFAHQLLGDRDALTRGPDTHIGERPRRLSTRSSHAC